MLVREERGLLTAVLRVENYESFSVVQYGQFESHVNIYISDKILQ